MKTVLLAVALAASSLAQTKLTPVDQAGFAKLITAHKGRVVLVDFWATWCKPCRAEMPELVKLEQKLRARGFDLVAISNDAPEAQAAALKLFKDDGIPGTAYWKNVADDDKFYDSIDRDWGGALPAVFLFDRTGKKVKSFIGETPVKDIEAAIAKVL